MFHRAVSSLLDYSFVAVWAASKSNGPSLPGGCLQVSIEVTWAACEPDKATVCREPQWCCGIKIKAASTCSHSCKWGTSQSHRTMCYSGLQRGDTWWPGKKFPHCLPCVHWGCPVCWGTVGCLWGDACLCPAALSQSGRRTGSLCTLSRCKYLFIIFFFYFFGKDCFLPCPSLLTRCLWHLTGPAYGDMEEGRKQQREREGKASFWKHENFWNINLVDNSLPAEFH